MPKILFEDMEVNISVENTVTDTSYDIQDNMLVTKNIVESITTSNIYNYDDGFSAYLKFERSGSQIFIYPMLAVFSIGDEKKLANTTDSADITLKRIDKKHFHLTIDDPLNNCGSTTFVTINSKGEFVKVDMNYTSLVNYDVVGNVVILNSYEKATDDKIIWNVGIYDLGGKIKKVLVDKHTSTDVHYDVEIVVKKEFKRLILVYMIKGDKNKVVAKYPVKLPPPPKKTKKQIKEEKELKKQQAKLLKEQAKLLEQQEKQLKDNDDEINLDGQDVIGESKIVDENLNQKELNENIDTHNDEKLDSEKMFDKQIEEELEKKFNVHIPHDDEVKVKNIDEDNEKTNDAEIDDELILEKMMNKEVEVKKKVAKKTQTAKTNVKTKTRAKPAENKSAVKSIKKTTNNKNVANKKKEK